MHCTYEAIILQHHQIQSSKWAREENGCSFPAIFSRPPERWNSFATFFFLCYSSTRIFFYYICAACDFFLPTSACRKCFFKITHPPPPSRVKWSAPKHTCVLTSKYDVFSSGVSLGIKTHPPDQKQTSLIGINWVVTSWIINEFENACSNYLNSFLHAKCFTSISWRVVPK